MKKFVVFILLAFASSLSAFAHFEKLYPDALQSIFDVGVYRGDKNGDFSGDSIYVLSDGSQWKIHPGDLGRCSSWKINQPVNVRARMDWCLWCKPKHQFLIYNRALNETARVMLVAHAIHPKKVIAAQPVDTLRQQITLSDSTEWIVPKKLLFKAGERIYIGSQGTYGKARDFVLIKGREAETEWSFARIINADYSQINEY